MEKWKLLSSKMAFDHRFFKLRQDTVKLPNGKVLDDFFVWLQGDVCLVVPVTKNNEFILVRQYKHGSGDIIFEFPAGMADDGESPEVGAERELEEETGYSSPKITYLGVVENNPTKVVGDVHIYLAEDVVKDKEVNFDENEEIEVIVKPYKEVLQMIYSGEIRVSGTIVAAFLACKKLGLPID